MSSLFIVGIASCLIVSDPGEALQSQRQQAVDIAKQNPHVKEFLERHPGTELRAHFSKEFQVWLIEPVNHDQKFGIVTVKDGRVVELDLEDEGSRQPTSAREMLEHNERIGELRERFGELEFELSPTDDPEAQFFEVIVEGREVAAGAVNLEAGWVRFNDDDRAEREETGEERNFFRALCRAIRFPLGGNGLVWFSSAITLLVVFPFRRPFRLQSLDVLVLLSVFPLVMLVWGHRFETYVTLFVVTGYLSLRCLWKAFARSSTVEATNVPTSRLAGILLLVLVAHLQAVVTRGPDDSGIWSAFGGQYLWRHGRLPYGQIGGGATYGPLLYAINAPLTYLLPPTAPAGEPGAPGQRVIVDRHNIEHVGYRNCDFLPAKLLVLVFDLALLIGLLVIGRQSESVQLGLVIALVYAVSGLTIARDLLFISHVAPTTCVVLAIACRRHAIASGVLLGCGAAILFWPAFLIPLWLGYFGSRGLGPLLKSAVAITVVGLTAVAAVWLFTEPVEHRGPLTVFLDSTWRHQEGGGPYSHSEFGLWGQWIRRQPGSAREIDTVKKIVCASYFALCLLPTVFVFRRQPVPAMTLIALSAFFALGLQFWKTHGGGLYTGWYFPLTVATLFATGSHEKLVHCLTSNEADRSS